MAELRFATCLSPNARPVYEYVTEQAGRALGVDATLVDGPPFEEFDPEFADVCFVCGLPYVILAGWPEPPVELLAAPVLEGERYRGAPIYFSDVIVRRDAPFGSFSDLRGASWAYNEPYSHSGYNITRWHLVKMGETNGFFGSVVESGFHLESIRMVREGRIDASAIDSQVLAIELRDDPTLREEIRIIDVLGPATIQPVVAARRLSSSLREELREVLVGLADRPGAGPALSAGLVERFVPIADADYDDIRGMVEAAEAAGFMTLR
jgi:phosphonate transport system substrate-binding protein